MRKMKKMNYKKYFVFLLLFLLLITPNVTLADDDCTSTKVSGDAIGKADSPETPPCVGDDCCDKQVCLWNWYKSYDKNTGEPNNWETRGVRIQIYKYKDGVATLIGHGVDIWGRGRLKRDDYKYTSPNTNNLANKLSPNCSAPRNLGSTYTLTGSQYLGSTEYNVYVDGQLEAAFESGDDDAVPDFLLVKDSDGNPIDGWIYDNFFSKIIDGSDAKLNEIYSVFGISRAQIDDILENPDDYYITAEILYRFLLKRTSEEYKNAGGEVGIIYNGTVSEGGYFHGAKDIYNKLLSAYEDVGILVGKNSSDPIWQRSPEIPGTYYDITSGSDSPNKQAACNSAYGYAVWNMSICRKCINEPKKTTCSSTCSEYKVGTKEHTECAKNYCSNIPEGAQEEGQTLAACMNTCDTCKDVCKNDTDKKTCAENWCSAYDPTNSNCVNTCVEQTTCEEDCKGKTGTDLRTCAEEWCRKNASGDTTCVDKCAPVTNKKTCLQTCSGKTGLALKSCAENWCSANSNDPSCVSNCAPPERIKWSTYVGEGCKSEFKTCTGYTDGMSSYATKKDFVCSSTLEENVDYFLSSLVCRDGKSANSDLTDIYYTIECQEDVNLVGLPTDNLYVHLSEAGSSSIYLGYDLQYNKTCKLRFKKAPSDSVPSLGSTLPKEKESPTKGNWIEEYGNGATMIEYDLKRVEKMIDEITKRKNDIISMGINDSGGTANSSLSLNQVIDAINTLEETNTRNKYRSYVKPNDYSGGLLTCNDWTQYECLYNTTCYNYECGCYYAPCSCNCTKTRGKIYSYKSCPALSDNKVFVGDGEKAACEDAEKNIKDLLGYYNLALSKLNAMKVELSGMREKAKNALKNETEKYYKDDSTTTTGTTLINQVSINLVDKYGEAKEKKNITLEPITCVTAEEEAKRYCEFTDGSRDFALDDATKRIKCGDVVTEAKLADDYTGVYSITVGYGLPSSYLRTLSEKSREVYHSLSECEKARLEDKDNTGSCIEKEHVWVFDPVDKTVSIEAFIQKVKSKDFNVKMSGVGECAQFEATLDCKYQFSDYSECAPSCNGDDECLKRECGCDSYCGSNETCRFMYCPDECEDCDKECPDECRDKCAPDDVKCLSDECCSLQCNGEDECLRNCCLDECASLYGTNGDEYEACRKGCPDPSDNPGDGPNGPGINYVFRPIDMDNPFPERKPGKNWSGKVEYITRSNDPNGIYYDSTDGRTDDYEYQITIKAKGIKEIRNRYSTGNELTYKEFERVGNDTNSVYCSKVIHEDLKNDLSEYVTVEGECLKLYNNKKATS